MFWLKQNSIFEGLRFFGPFVAAGSVVNPT